MKKPIQSLCVFCGSNLGRKPEYEAAARDLGRLLAERGIRLVYGGGNIGLMGILADTVLAGGGKVIGVIPHALKLKEVAHQDLTELYVVDSMHERKALMAELAQGFIALPGGYGTLEEFCEVLTWAQLGIHRKPCGLLNAAGFFDPFVSFLDHAVAEQFIRAEHRAIMFVESEPARLLEQFAQYKPPLIEKWINRDET